MESGNDLLDVLYQANREDKDKILEGYLDRSKELIGGGFDVNSRDRFGRTALHWAVIGAVHTSGKKARLAYVEVIESLLAHGADVNAEDDDGLTPLDWQAVTQDEEIEALLVENGARFGTTQDESARIERLLVRLVSAADNNDLAAIHALIDTSLPPGTDLQIRLTSAVSSKESRAGDPVEAVVIAPVRVRERIMVEAGTRVQGSVMLARRAPNKYEHAYLILDFAYLVHTSGAKTQLAARLTAVDNARETVRNGHITGFAYPHTFMDKLGLGMRAVGIAAPAVGYALQAATWGFVATLDREIHYGPGVEMTLRVLMPEELREIPETASGPPEIPVQSELVEALPGLPRRTQTPSGTPSDISNVLLVASRAAVEAAFTEAGWVEAVKLSTSSGIKTFLATVRNKGYEEAPVTNLLLEGRKPDLVYQKQNNTFAKRHHVRLWEMPSLIGGQPVWIGAGTHDIGIGADDKGRKWYHRIDSRIDGERTKIGTDLTFTGRVNGWALADRPDLPRDLRNATGDRLETDGRLLVLILEEPAETVNE